MKKRFIATALVAVAAFASAANAAEKLKIGFLATLEGTYTVLGEDGLRGFQVALKKFGNKAGGRDIEVIIAPTDASPDSAIRAARKVVEQDKVDIVIGPLSGSEGIAIRDYSKTQPQVTFLNGVFGCTGNDLRDAIGKTSSVSISTAHRCLPVSANTSTTKKAIRPSRQSVKTIHSSIRRYSVFALGFLCCGRRNHRTLMGATGNQGFRFDHRFPA